MRNVAEALVQKRWPEVWKRSWCPVGDTPVFVWFAELVRECPRSPFGTPRGYPLSGIWRVPADAGPSVQMQRCCSRRWGIGFSLGEHEGRAMRAHW
jgi:hypothetical protein